MFNALQIYNVRSTDRVKLVGIGDLGHLAIQFASKMGCEVVIFSGIEGKKSGGDEAWNEGVLCN